MSKILRTPLSRQNEFFVPMINFITESLSLESDFLKQIYTSDLFSCAFAAHRTPEKQQQLAPFTMQCVQQPSRLLP